MSEFFDKSQMSEMIDVPAGCLGSLHNHALLIPTKSKNQVSLLYPPPPPMRTQSEA